MLKKSIYIVILVVLLACSLEGIIRVCYIHSITGIKVIPLQKIINNEQITLTGYVYFSDKEFKYFEGVPKIIINQDIKDGPVSLSMHWKDEPEKNILVLSSSIQKCIKWEEEVIPVKTPLLKFSAYAATESKEFINYKRGDNSIRVELSRDSVNEESFQAWLLIAPGEYKNTIVFPLLRSIVSFMVLVIFGVIFRPRADQA